MAWIVGGTVNATAAPSPIRIVFRLTDDGGGDDDFEGDGEGEGEGNGEGDGDGPGGGVLMIRQAYHSTRGGRAPPPAPPARLRRAFVPASTRGAQIALWCVFFHQQSAQRMPLRAPSHQTFSPVAW